MSLLNMFGQLFGTGTVARESRVYIVDGTGMEGGQKRQAPRNQLDILRRVSRFAQREKIKVHIAFSGTELRQIGNGDEYEGVTVRFTGKDGTIDELVLQLFRQFGRRASLVLTSKRELEEAIHSKNGNTMRLETFRKALDENGEGSRNYDRPRKRNPRSRSRNKNQRTDNGNNNEEKKQGNGQGQGKGGKPNNQNRPRPKPRQPKAADPVSDLIDLVD